ncbi:MAG: RNA 2',3'-cyclic phosphodiesterase [Clostridia bacterium]|nr:RNA 2',3'-cyclic phosphodiesterase [Clostridia bacterium]
MRLFIAINFDDEIKDQLNDITQNLKTNSEYGNFTRRENLHLTLVFIGESQNVSAIKKAMDSVCAQSFEISISALGKFKRTGGDIYWLGVKKHQILSDIYKQLHNCLLREGFSLENREYKPHLTLGREVKLKDSFDREYFQKNIKDINVPVSKISLMKSERLDGKLTYTEIYSKTLYNK